MWRLLFLFFSQKQEFFMKKLQIIGRVEAVFVQKGENFKETDSCLTKWGKNDKIYSERLRSKRKT